MVDGLSVGKTVVRCCAVALFRCGTVVVVVVPLSFESSNNPAPFCFLLLAVAVVLSAIRVIHPPMHRTHGTVGDGSGGG